MKTKEACMKCAKNAPFVVGGVEIIFCVAKVVVGILSNSLGVVADAFNSGGDVLFAVGMVFTMRISKKPPDREHPYGHGKIEFVFGACTGITMIVGAIVLFASGVYRLVNRDIEHIHYMAVLMEVFSITCSEMLFRYLRCPAAKMNSVAIDAMAWECRSDAIASIPVLAGVIGAQFGFLTLDSLAALVVAAFIGRNGFTIAARSIHGIMDAALDSETTSRIEDLVRSVAGVKAVEHLKSRHSGSEFHVDMQIIVDKGLSVESSSVIVEEVRRILRQNVTHLGHVAVTCRAETNQAENQAV